ncbi:RusA family crossover junction endodeoxyribonuclease [Leptospira mtsangambouensis]|uniref:RusA family crossover junction endodeoxyribonuclease n=1 Tax=Leptospira mtsangambouensis TaxID=2484912 RepID=UPI001EEBEF25|nr:RusA family crossover junction endodeoxyribonuclease [Leptospira mtsangambouensis]MCG6142814.1 RusA family crossover junction endodeoxyribonuclease [Leptospira mtsangambouensis]
MTNIKITHENCNYEKHFQFNDFANSSISIEIRFDKIVSVQSKKAHKLNLIESIKSEISKFSWLICGSVNLEVAFYLDAIQRQETDKIGDIDNITKPIIDSLLGYNGILIDDSQIGSLTSLWISRYETISENILKLKIEFNNDFCISKNNLIFIQYIGAICTPITFRTGNLTDMIYGLVLVKTRLKYRKFAEYSKKKYQNIDYRFVQSMWDFHKSRLNKFPKEQILTLTEFKSRCKNEGMNSISIFKIALQKNK